MSLLETFLNLIKTQLMCVMIDMVTFLRGEVLRYVSGVP